MSLIIELVLPFLVKPAPATPGLIGCIALLTIGLRLSVHPWQLEADLEGQGSQLAFGDEIFGLRGDMEVTVNNPPTEQMWRVFRSIAARTAGAAPAVSRMPRAIRDTQRDYPLRKMAWPVVIYVWQTATPQ